MNDATRSVWTLPGNRVKNGVTNLVPLSTQALRVIEKQRATLDFQNEKREARGKKAIKSAFLFPSRHVLKEKSMTVYALDQEAQRISNELNLSRFTPHDLRRTCATKLGQMQVPGHIIARVLNHKQTDITTAVCNQYEYLKEKKEALDKLGCWIVKLASGLELVHVPSTEA